MRLRKITLTAAVFTTLFAGGQKSTTIQADKLHQQLSDLTRRGFTYRLLSNDLVELTDPIIGGKRLKSLREPSEGTIRAWAVHRGIPILEIDPALIDTTQFVGWYNYWQQVPISGAPGQPVVVADVDGNGNPEIYGLVAVGGPITTIESRICEVDPPSFRYTYLPYPGVPTEIVDFDNDGLREIMFLGPTGNLTDYYQMREDTLPTTLSFVHITRNSGSGVSFIVPPVGYFDSDQLKDCLYKVSEIDSADTTFPFVLKLAVAEYDSTTHNLQRVWAMRVPPAGQPFDAIGNLASADFDQDGKQEFVTTGGLEGSVFLCENTGDNNYALTYQDSVPFVNLYRVTTGDVDDDGKPEFFVVATQGNGQWALMYEADSNDHYSQKLLIHFLSGDP